MGRCIVQVCYFGKLCLPLLDWLHQDPILAVSLNVVILCLWIWLGHYCGYHRYFIKLVNVDSQSRFELVWYIYCHPYSECSCPLAKTRTLFSEFILLHNMFRPSDPDHMLHKTHIYNCMYFSNSPNLSHVARHCRRLPHKCTMDQTPPLSPPSSQFWKTLKIKMTIHFNITSKCFQLTDLVLIVRCVKFFVCQHGDTASQTFEWNICWETSCWRVLENKSISQTTNIL